MIGPGETLVEYPHVKAPVALLTALMATTTAQAAEVEFDGFLRTRARLFNSLTMNADLDEGRTLDATWLLEHRFWVRPKIYITDQVGVFFEMRALDGLRWGSDPRPWIDDWQELEFVEPVYNNNLVEPASNDDFLAFNLWRAWGEIHTDVGTFKFGRQPLTWGMGIWQNDGLGWNADYGDTVDRVSWEHVFGPAWVRAAVDVNTAGLIHGDENAWSGNATAAYLSERIEAGLNMQYRRQTGSTGTFNMFTVSGAADVELGIARLEAEVVGQFGGGQLSGNVEDINLTSMGAVLKAGVVGEKYGAFIEGILATGDKDPQDNKFHTFTFDRDYNVGFILFEQPLPQLASTNPTEEDQGIDRQYVVSGDAVSNALLLKPQAYYSIVRGLDVFGSALFGWTAALPDQQRAANRNFYGVEINAGLRYTGIEHFELDARFGTLIPGGYYSNYSLDNTGASTFSKAVIGGQFVGRIHF